MPWGRLPWAQFRRPPNLRGVKTAREVQELLALLTSNSETHCSAPEHEAQQSVVMPPPGPLPLAELMIQQGWRGAASNSAPHQGMRRSNLSPWIPGWSRSQRNFAQAPTCDNGITDDMNP